MSEKDGVLKKPVCPKCGFHVKTDCVVGAGCPKCGARLLKAKAKSARAHEGE